MRSAIGYVRLSGGPESVALLDDQERAIRERARMSGLELGRVFADKGERVAGPQLREAISILEPGTTLLIPSIQTLSDDLLAQELALRDIRQRGALVISCQEEDAQYLDDDAASLARGLESQ